MAMRMREGWPSSPHRTEPYVLSASSPPGCRDCCARATVCPLLPRRRKEADSTPSNDSDIMDFMHLWLRWNSQYVGLQGKIAISRHIKAAYECECRAKAVVRVLEPVVSVDRLRNCGAKEQSLTSRLSPLGLLDCKLDCRAELLRGDKTHDRRCGSASQSWAPQSECTSYIEIGWRNFNCSQHFGKITSSPATLIVPVFTTHLSNHRGSTEVELIATIVKMDTGSMVFSSQVHHL